jgi:penicillin-binding protein 1A
VPTIKILEDIGVSYAMDYAKNLGVFSPLNADLSLGLGSSSVTLYEMTKVFSQFGRLGKRIHPLIVRKVTDRHGKVLIENLSLDQRFNQELSAIAKEFEEKKNYHANPAPHAAAANAQAGIPTVTADHPFLFDDPEQLIRPQTAYVMTTLLSGVINEDGGTAGAARSIGRPAAGKTGSTNGYFDGWFIGYTPQVATGVWVGIDEERSLGKGEVGAHTALPIWLEYMKSVHSSLPVLEFAVPPNIVFANLDTVSGSLASARSAHVVRQAFIEGTAPRTVSGSAPSNEDESEFLKKDLAD